MILRKPRVRKEIMIKPNVSVSKLISAQGIQLELRALIIIRTFVNAKTLSARGTLITLVSTTMILKHVHVLSLVMER